MRYPKLCTDPCPRTLDQFESRQEVLFALRDTVAGKSLSTSFVICALMYFYPANQVKWNASQVAHGDISIDTICIGDNKSPGARGFLINREDSTVGLFLPLYDQRPIHFFSSRNKMAILDSNLLLLSQEIHFQVQKPRVSIILTTCSHFILPLHTYPSLLLSLTPALGTYRAPCQFGPPILNLKKQLWRRELSYQVQALNTATSNPTSALSSLKPFSKIYIPFSSTVTRRGLLGSSVCRHS